MPTRPRLRLLLAAVIAAAALAWVALLVVTPSWRASVTSPRAAAAGAVYSLASRVCHQRPERSFALVGTPMPVCARCTGLYASGAAGAALALLWTASARGRSQDSVPRMRMVLVWSALPTALAWGLEVSGLFVPSMGGRAFSALPLGAVTGWVVTRAATGWLR